MSHYEIIIYLFLRHVNAIFENNSLFEISIEMSQNVKYNLVGGINMLKLKELREKKGLLRWVKTEQLYIDMKVMK